MSNADNFASRRRRRLRWEWLASIVGVGGIAALVYFVPWEVPGTWIVDTATAF